MMSRLAWASWVLAMVLLLCCRPKQLEIDEARLYSELEARAGQAADSAATDAQLEALFESVAADAAIARSGERTLTAIGSDPSLQPSFSAILEQIGSEPTVVAQVEKLMRDNPGLSPEQVGQHFEKRVSAVTEGPMFDRAWDGAFDGLMAKPDLQAALRRFGQRLGRNEHVDRAVREAVRGHISDAQWLARLEKLNGGHAPDEARATDLLLDNAFTKERFERFYGELFALPVVKAQTTKLVQALLDAPSFTKHAIAAVGMMVADADFQKRAIEGMLVLLEDSPSQQAVDGAVRRLLEVDIVTRALTTFVDDLLADPALAQAGGEALAAIAADEAFRATVLRFVDGW